MRYALLITAAMAAMLAGSPATATIRISGDNGGQLGPYLKHLEDMRKSGEQVVIDGPCLSACTMLLGVIPRNRICVTSRAQLGFHAAWKPDQSGEQVTSREGTQLLMQHYPQPIRSWISQRGGLSRQMIYLSGGELASMYGSCDRPSGKAPPSTSASRTIGGAPSDFAQAPTDTSGQESNEPIGIAAPHRATRRAHR
jgi:hypothetical protein